MTTRSTPDFDGIYPVYENETSVRFNLGLNESSPTVSNLTPDLFTNTNTFFAPSINSNLTPGLLTNTNTFYSPNLHGENNLLPPLFTNTNTFYSPSITSNLYPGLLTNTSTFYSPSLQYLNNITPGLFTNTNTFYSPAVIHAPIYIYPGLVTNSNSFYSPYLYTSLRPLRFENENVFFPPTLTRIAPQEPDEGRIFRRERRQYTMNKLPLYRKLR